MRPSLSLRTQLSIVFAAVTILLIFIFCVVFGYQSTKQVESEIGNSLSEAAYLMENNLDQYMWSRYGETSILSNLPEIRNLKNEENVELLLNQLQTTFPAFSWIGLTSKEGKVIASTDSLLKGVDISSRPVYFEALKKPFVGDVHEAVLLADLLPNPSGEAMKFVDISTPVYDDNDNFTGVLATHLSWEWISEIESAMLESIKNQESTQFLIVSKIDNSVIIGPDKLIGEKIDLESIDVAQTRKNGWMIETWPDGQEYMTGYMLEDGYKEYPGLGWTILVRQPLEVAYAPIKELLTFFLVTGIILALLFAVLGWFLAGRIASPLNDIAKIADRLLAGESVQIPHYRGLLEMEILSNSLRKLVLNLTKTESALVQMEEMATRDELTGLANRYALDVYLAEFTQRHKAAAILYIDLDGFKKVNDTLGHLAGDDLLVQVATRLKKNMREGGMISRIGGDEFIVILPSAKKEGIKKGKQIGERIISSIRKVYSLNGSEAYVSCSIGAAYWEAFGTVSIGEAIETADKALYEAKRKGKNRIQISRNRFLRA